jgi:hypothetical protein
LKENVTPNGPLFSIDSFEVFIVLMWFMMFMVFTKIAGIEKNFLGSGN